MTSVQPGLCMYAARVESRSMPVYDFDINIMPVEFSFCLGGKIGTTYTRYGDGRAKKADRFINQRGVNAISHMRQVKGHSQFLSDEPSRSVAILIDKDLLMSYLKTEINKIPDECHQVLQWKTPLLPMSMTPLMYRVASQIFNPVYHGAARQLYLESLALELLALQIDRLTCNAFSHAKPLCRADMERIHAAADILTKNMQSPPTIPALARRVGINESKLKKGFKQAFDSTIFQFLLHHRMTCAREMITAQGMDVTQTAFHVGYNNISHFIICYKNAFGVTPGYHKRAWVR